MLCPIWALAAHNCDRILWCRGFTELIRQRHAPRITGSSWNWVNFRNLSWFLSSRFEWLWQWNLSLAEKRFDLVQHAHFLLAPRTWAPTNPLGSGRRFSSTSGDGRPQPEMSGSSPSAGWFGKNFLAATVFIHQRRRAPSTGNVGFATLRRVIQEKLLSCNGFHPPTETGALNRKCRVRHPPPGGSGEAA